jgi:hypothetical protein
MAWLRVTVFEHVAGDEHQIDLGVNAYRDGFVEAREEIGQSRVHACARIEMPVVFDSDVQICQMQDTDHTASLSLIVLYN